MTEAESRQEITPRFWRRVRLRALLPYALTAALLVGLMLVFGREMDRYINAIEAWIQGLGPWGMVVFIGLFAVFSSLLVPDTVLGIIAGALFGLAGGTIAVVVGTLVAASLQYFLSHHLLRSRIERMLSARPSLLAIQRAVRGQEFRLQVLLRLTPLNPAAISYALGATGVRFGSFIIACFTLIPHLFLEVYFGHAGKHLARMAGDDKRAVLMHDAVIVGGLLLCVVAMVLVSRMARKAVQKAVA
jgi:uncharacterized membrane protein YdjX (TVP38/TMEM64 family)